MCSSAVPVVFKGVGTQDPEIRELLLDPRSPITRMCQLSCFVAPGQGLQPVRMLRTLQLPATWRSAPADELPLTQHHKNSGVQHGKLSTRPCHVAGIRLQGYPDLRSIFRCNGKQSQKYYRFCGMFLWPVSCFVTPLTACTSDQITIMVQFTGQPHLKCNISQWPNCASVKM